MLDVDKLIDGVHDYVARAVTPLAERVKTLELRQPEKGDKGLDGAPGEKGIQGSQGERGEKGQDGENGAPGPKGDPGEPGKPGDRGEPGEKGDAGIQGKSGADGNPGPAGLNGKDGTSLTVDDIRPILEGEMAKAVLELERRASDVLQRSLDRLPKPADPQAEVAELAQHLIARFKQAAHAG